LREGLDLPEVSFVAILDADKEGFLRNERSLTQTIGRASRNVNGFVILYADRMTKSMQRTIDETLRRRSIQIAHNEEHGFVPTALNKSIDKILESTKVADGDPALRLSKYERNTIAQKVAESSDFYGVAEDLEKQIMSTKKMMEKAAKEMDFLEAARLRDAMNLLISKRKK